MTGIKFIQIVGRADQLNQRIGYERILVMKHPMNNVYFVSIRNINGTPAYNEPVIVGNLQDIFNFLAGMFHGIESIVK